jgi:uncharacterized protein (TIGR02246 family)
MDAAKVSAGAGTVLGTIQAGAFPRELSLSADQRTLFVTNFKSKTLEVVDLARLQLNPNERPGEPVPVGTSANEEAILRFREAHSAAYNNHDAKGLANLYAPDGDRITNAGDHFTGRNQIEQSYAVAFKGASRNAFVKDESASLRFLTPEVALVDVDDAITGRADGITIHNHVASIYVKNNGQWFMAAERATRKQ